MTSAEIFQAMRLADMSKVRAALDRLEIVAKRNEEVAEVLVAIYNLFNDAKREPK